MSRKKTIELVEETQLPQALIVNGGDISSFLAKILAERGCEVTAQETYSPIHNKFDYIFLFDNHPHADKICENNLKSFGKFILVETGEELNFPFSHKFKILKIGDASFWSLPELADKILRTLFSSAHATVDLRRKPKVLVKSKKEIVKEKKEILPIIEKPQPHPIPPPLVEKKRRFNFGKVLFGTAFVLLGTLLVFAGIAYGYAVKMQKTFNDLEYHLKSGNLTAVASDFATAKGQIATTQKVYNFATNLLFPLKNNPSVESAGILLASAEKTVDSGGDFAAAAAGILPRTSGFGQTEGSISKGELQVLEKKLTVFIASLIDAQEKTDKVNLPYFPREKIQATILPVISKLTAAYEIIPVFEEVFFADTPKVYLVLFQNNMELRPTGGFIGSFALLTVDNGKIGDFKIEDVYTADGQLKGHVDPPAPIRKYLGQPHFFLRDSNFNPDFAVSAAQAAWFLQKELGKNVDGVIGVNLTLAQKLMQVVGSVKLDDFSGEEITADNFFYKVHSLSQTNFFPGSTQKKDVLTALSNGIFSKITSEGRANPMELLPVVKQALEEKNILIYLDSEKLQKIIEDRGWAGRMVKVSCTQKKTENGKQISSDSNSCLADYLSVIEANLGVNKANYFIDKSTIIEKKIQPDDQISTTVTISYENTNDTLILQPQTYTNYLRVFVPAGSKLVGVTLNNVAISAGDIDTENYTSDKTSFGFLVKIAPDNKGVVKITYTLPRSFSPDIGNYQLFYQKQAGDKNSPLIFSLTYPEKLRMKPDNFTSAGSGDNGVYYTTDTSVDRVFALRKE